VRRAGLGLGFVLGALACPAPGGPPAVAPPGKAGFSAERLARLTARMQELEADPRISGVVTLVWRKGRLVHADALGYQDVESKTPMRRDTLFRIASMTKPITSVAVLMLVEDGKLNLGDPVDRWLPELAERRVLRNPGAPLDATRPAKRAITVRDLLTQRSGLGYPFTTSGPISQAMTEAGLNAENSALSPAEWMDRLGKLPLVVEPGTRWLYGLSTDVLGVLVERVSGMPFPEFLRTRLFEPLGMQDTAFQVPPEKMDRLATLYALDPQTGEVVATDRPPESQFATAPAFASGGGGLVSTADDYLRFARMLLGGGELDGVRILSPRMVERMTTDHLTEPQRRSGFVGPDFFAGQGFGFGVAVIDKPALAVDSELVSAGTYGWGGAHGTWHFVDPAEGLIGVLMIQFTGGGQVTPIVEAFETAIYQAIVE
jgi:CubicO group peptidase (beta-lactamase class C family)